MIDLVPNPSEAVSDRLRQATHERHRRIERVPRLHRLFAKDYTQAEYRHLLARLWGFYAAIEPGLASALADSAGEDFRRPAKAPLLAADLVALGLSSGELADLPRCTRPPRLDGIADALGASYVVEGSTQGGVLIRKHLCGHFGPEIEAALSFYTGYGANTGVRWEEFKTALNARFERIPEAIPDLIGAANETFDRMTEWLEGGAL